MSIMRNLQQPFILLIGIWLLIVSCQSQVVPNIVNPNQFYTFNGTTLSYSYYQVTFTDPQALIAITVATPINIYVGLAISGSWEDNPNQFPTLSTSSITCFYSTLDTCVVSVPESIRTNKTVTVFFSVEVGADTSYSVQAVQMGLVVVDNVPASYQVNFTLQESTALIIPTSSMKDLEAITISFIQDLAPDHQDRFDLFAYKGSERKETTAILRSESLGWYQRILKLPALTDEPYTIIVEGTLKRILNLQFTPATYGNTTLYASKMIGDIVPGPDHYCQYYGSFPADDPDSYLVIQLSSNSGYGVFNVDYCDGISIQQFQNVDGEKGQIVISPEQRSDCMSAVQQRGSLLIESVIVHITDISYELGFSIRVLEDTFQPALNVAEKVFGQLAFSPRQYILHSSDSNYPMVVRYQSLGNSNCTIAYSLIKCKPDLFKRQKCNVTIEPRVESSGSFSFMPKSGQTYKMQLDKRCPSAKYEKEAPKYVIQSDYDGVYTVSLRAGEKRSGLGNEFSTRHFIFNISEVMLVDRINITVGTKVTFRLLVNNGDAVLLTSPTNSNITIEDIFGDNDTEMWWNGLADYTVNKTTTVIYAAVYCFEESDFTLQLLVDTDSDLPQKYTQLEANIESDFVLNKENPYQLLRFASHDIGYRLTIRPTPSCIRWTYTLPMPLECSTTLPSHLNASNLYLNISDKLTNPSKSLRVSVIASVDGSQISRNHPLVISCDETCNQSMTVTITEPTTLVHWGDGFVNNTQNNSSYTNEAFEVSCPSTYPCQVALLGQITNGGLMTVCFIDDQGETIDFNRKPIPMNSLPFKLFMKLTEYDDDSSFVLVSQAAALKVYYNVFVFNSDKGRYLQYDFPTDKNYMSSTSMEPLKQSLLVQFDPNILQQLQCLTQGVTCIVTALVDYNSTIQYSKSYLEKGVAFYSRGSYSYRINVNEPIMFFDDCSLRSFDVTDVAYWNTSLRIKITTLSTCRPIINYQGQTYHTTINIGSVKALQFTITSDTSCLYSVIVESTPYPQIEANRLFRLHSGLKKQLMFVYNHLPFLNDLQITIKPTAGNVIAIRGTALTTNITLPTDSNAAFSASGPTVTVTSLTADTYLIAVDLSDVTQASVLIQSPSSSAITLMNLESAVFPVSDNQDLRFMFNSNSDFALFVKVQFGPVRLTITRLQNSKIIFDGLIDGTSAPWILVEAVTDEVVEYWIVAKWGGKQKPSSYPKITLYPEETGYLGLPQLYDGVAVEDGLNSGTSIDKYKIVAPINSSRIVIDVVFREEVNLINLHMMLKCPNGTIISSIGRPSAYAVRIIGWNNSSPILILEIGSKWTLTTALEYYVVAFDGSIPHLADNFTIQTNIGSLYRIFEVVSLEADKQLVEVISCTGSTFLGWSQSFEDALNGIVTELPSKYSSKDVFSSLVDLPKGYSYLIAKSATQSLYEISLAKTNLTSIVNAKWKLPRTNFSLNIFEGELVIEFPLLQNIGPNQQDKPKLFTYILNLLDTTRQHVYNISTITKCSRLGNPTLTRTVAGVDVVMAVFRIPIKDLPKKFDVSGRAQVNQDNTTAVYFYDSKTIKVNTEESKEGLSSPIIFFTLILIAILIIGSLILLARRWKIRQLSTRMAFEMADVNRTNEVEQSSRPRPILNEGNAYGEFVDESH